MLIAYTSGGAVARANGSEIHGTVPCRHAFPNDQVEAAKKLLLELGAHGDLLRQAGVNPAEWDTVLRAAIESMRGSFAADVSAKKRFIEAVLTHCQGVGAVTSWTFAPEGQRYEYSVLLPDGTRAAIKAKGGGDGDNMKIWERPEDVDEFVIWSLSPESLTNQPGEGVWAAIANRLMPKMAEGGGYADAFIFWDGRCGTDQRRCDKPYGVQGLRAAATDLPGQLGKSGWLPPPCVYLLPQRMPDLPTSHRSVAVPAQSGRFASALLWAFGVPQEEIGRFLHEAVLDAAGGQTQKTRIKVTVISRRPDGIDHSYAGAWKTV